ncbi:MAG TPA: polysaccharide biosynthesis tyrosine autokinase [Solirubrobacter sp.]|nr:polysaccharide biosynthesis tyrosine autokinase [Solirubrobacter sp.]
MQLAELLTILKKRRFGVMFVVMLTVAFAAAIALITPPRYEATATLTITPKSADNQALIGAGDVAALLSTYAETAESRVNRARAQQILGRPLPGEVDTSTVGGTGILRITGNAATPQDAADTANAAAQGFMQSLDSNPLIVVSLINPPEPPTAAVQPRPPLIVAVGILLGLLAGISYALVMERVRRRLETPQDINDLTDKPVVGRLPRQRALQRVPASLVWNEERMTGLQEAYRALRTNVQFLAEGKRVIEVTSPDPAQGKSTVVANLGVALAQIGVDTVILDADLRRPMQHKIFGIDNAIGLANLLSVRDPHVDLKPSGFPNLWVVPSGPPPPDPTELLHVRLAGLVDRFRDLDALILIDTPPVLPVSDARLIAPHCDGVLMVVSAGAVKPTALESALDRLEIVRANLLGIVLNQSGADLEAAGGYYYTSPESAAV